MPNPARSDVHVNAPLTNISVAHVQDQASFVATALFPKITVPKQSDLYFKYSQEDFFRSAMQRRAPGTETAGAGYDLSTDTYSCDVFGLHKDIDDQIRANTDAPLDMDRDATIFLTQQYLLKRDIDFASTFFQASVWTGSTTGDDLVHGTTPILGPSWNAANATPIKDIGAQLDAVELKTGFRPSTVLMGSDAMFSFTNCDDVISRIKYTQKGIVTEDMVAGLLGVSKVVVARSIQNSSVEGATANYGRIFNSNAVLLAYANPTPSLLSPSAGYCFTWGGLGAGGMEGQRVSRFRMDHLRSDRIEIEAAYDMKVVSPTCGAFFTNVNT